VGRRSESLKHKTRSRKERGKGERGGRDSNSHRKNNICGRCIFLAEGPSIDVRVQAADRWKCEKEKGVWYEESLANRGRKELEMNNLLAGKNFKNSKGSVGPSFSGG